MGFLTWLIVNGIGGAVITVCPVLAPAYASMVGISTVGVGAGTIAAGAQAYIGNVAAGSTFAVLQSAIMSPALP